MSILSTGDRVFMQRKAMPAFGIPHVEIKRSTSKKNWPDIWTDGRSITVTKEWARQTTPERRKRLVHECLHLRGLEHGPIRVGSRVLEYSTYPHLDTYSKEVYCRLLQNPNPSIEDVQERFQGSLATVVSQLTHLFPGKVTFRLKTVASIEEKLVRRKLPLAALTDIAGARVVFPTLDSLYAGLKQIRRSFEVVEEEDYISQPKGAYRSYHLLVLSQGLPVEVQLKTPRMLEWGEIGHYQFPIYKERETVKERYGKRTKKLVAYYERMAEHYARSDMGEVLKRPKATAWLRAGLPIFTLNPICPECGTPNTTRPRIMCSWCGRYLVMRRRT